MRLTDNNIFCTYYICKYYLSIIIRGTPLVIVAFYCFFLLFFCFFYHSAIWYPDSYRERTLTITKILGLVWIESCLTLVLVNSESYLSLVGLGVIMTGYYKTVIIIGHHKWLIMTVNHKRVIVTHHYKTLLSVVWLESCLNRIFWHSESYLSHVNSESL